MTSEIPSHTQEESNESPLHKWVARHLIFLTTITVALHLVGLHVRKAIFGGGTGWLTYIKYVTWQERLGLLTIVLILSTALCGLWIFLWLRIGRWRKRPPRRTLVGASISWCMILSTDFFVRHKIHTMLGHAFDFMDFAAGIDNWTLLIKNTWNWFGQDLLYGLGATIGGGFICYALLRLLRSETISWGILDRINIRYIKWGVTSMVMASLLFFTAFAHTWPTTRELLAKDTLLGLPFQILVTYTTDFDGDGYSQFESPADTMPFDADFHPYAVDIPDDGKDQDLQMGDLVLASIPEMARNQIDDFMNHPPVTFTNKMNVIYVTLESVRFDALHRKINNQWVTPNLRSLIDERGALKPQHVYASKGFTQTSITQLFWGGFYQPETTLVDDFKSNGYFVGTFSGYDVKEEGFEKENGLIRGDLIFDPRFDPEMGEWDESIPSSRLMRKMVNFIDAYEQTKPFFLYVHLMDPHFPYNQTNPHVLTKGPISRNEINRDHKKKLTEVYMNQVHHVDLAIGKMIAALERRNLLDNTVIFFISDHGESLFDDDLLLGHGTAINEVMTRCAAVIHNSPIDVEDVFSHYDIRKLIAKMLTSEKVENPRMLTVPGRQILHYLGWIEHPSKIGFFSPEKGRLWYDFKQNVAYEEKRNLKQSLTSKTVDLQLLNQARSLIHMWEYLQYRQSISTPIKN